MASRRDVISNLENHHRRSSRAGAGWPARAALASDRGRMGLRHRGEVEHHPVRLARPIPDGDLEKGDVGYIPQGYGHSLENMGNKPCRVLIGFNTGVYAAIDLSQWIAGNPLDVLATNFGQPPATIAQFPKQARVHRRRQARRKVIAARWCPSPRCSRVLSARSRVLRTRNLQSAVDKRECALANPPRRQSACQRLPGRQNNRHRRGRTVVGRPGQSLPLREKSPQRLAVARRIRVYPARPVYGPGRSASPSVVLPRREPMRCWRHSRACGPTAILLSLLGIAQAQNPCAQPQAAPLWQLVASHLGRLPPQQCLARPVRARRSAGREDPVHADGR